MCNERFVLAFCFSAHIGQNADDISVRHGVSLVQIAHGGAQFAVCSAKLTYDDLCVKRIGIFDFNGILQFFLISPH